eukprot:m51a1_g6340 putative dna polymerase beta (360) ;mRNA; r:32937-34539
MKRERECEAPEACPPAAKERRVDPGPPAQNLNKDLTDALMEVAVTEKNSGQMAKFHVYQRAIHALRTYPKRVSSGEEARRLRSGAELDGIGVKIAKKIQELLDTGKLGRIEKARGDERTVAINLIARIPGVGPKSAKKFVDEDKVRTLDDMRRIEGKLNNHQRIGLKYFEDLEKKVPREEIAQIEAIVKKEAAKVDPRLACEAVGSYRRGLPESGDIDVLMTHPDYTTERKDRKDTGGLLTDLVARLRACGLLIETISEGFMQFMGICRLDPSKPARHLDLKLFPAESFHCGLLHFTGSGEHNRYMSTIALKNKFFLNEYCLCPVGTTGVRGDPLPISSEEDIFAYLGLDYKTPEQRCM